MDVPYYLEDTVMFRQDLCLCEIVLVQKSLDLDLDPIQPLL